MVVHGGSLDELAFLAQWQFDVGHSRAVCFWQLLAGGEQCLVRSRGVAAEAWPVDEVALSRGA